MLGFLLAMCLPESYSMLCTVITNADMSTITSKWVVDRIIGEEKQRLRNFRGTAAAFYAKAGKGKQVTPSWLWQLEVCSLQKEGPQEVRMPQTEEGEGRARGSYQDSLLFKASSEERQCTWGRGDWSKGWAGILLGWRRQGEGQDAQLFVGRQENSLGTVRTISQVLYTNTGWSVHTSLG